MASMARLLAKPRFWSAWDPRMCAAAATATAGVFSWDASSGSLRCDASHGHTHQGDHYHKDMSTRFKHTHDGSTTDKNLLFAIPKKGRLFEKVTTLLKGAGIEYVRKDRVDIAHSSNLPISIVFLPAADIATYVGEGEVDLGITGEDWVAESNVEVDVLMALGFGKCNLSVQAPKRQGWTPENLAGKRIVTSFPVIAQKFFASYEKLGKPTQIKCISGSVEAACGLGLADGIVDLVETGTTMKAAGLEEVAVVMKSQAVLIANKHTTHPELIELVQRRIQGWLTAQAWAMVTYNVHRSLLPVVEKITPGKKSPSIQPLEDPEFVAVSALVPKKECANIMDDLERAGATDVILTQVLVYRQGNE